MLVAPSRPLAPRNVLEELEDFIKRNGERTDIPQEIDPTASKAEGSELIIAAETPILQRVRSEFLG